MFGLTRVLFVFVLGLTGVVGDPGDVCYAEYLCEFEATDEGITFQFDISELCRSGGGSYSVNDSMGHQYSFNLCGTASFECVPSWSGAYLTGAAVQYWGEVPLCNASTANCTDQNGNNVCCTQPCEVLGVGVPQFELKDGSNPETGGILVSHPGAMGGPDDHFPCPWNPKIGSTNPRTITFDIACNMTMPVGALTILGAEENATNPCTYTIYLESFHGCGCAPDCANRNCGLDGCGGFCGSMQGMCPYGYMCLNDGVCCQPDCVGRECGSDGCGGTCGQCANGTACAHNVCGGMCQNSNPLFANHL